MISTAPSTQSIVRMTTRLSPTTPARPRVVAGSLARVLVELAVGDAYGAGFEYVDRATVRAYNDLSGYRAHPRHRIRPGCYTDDTQMSLAVAEAVVDGLPWTPTTLAAKFVEVFKRDPRDGYARGFRELLARVDSGDQLLAEIHPHSDRSGAAMRAAPIGVLPSVAQVLDHARTQAAVTHDTPDGVNAACAAALMAHYLIYRLGTKADLGRFLQQHVPGDWAAPWRGEVGAQGWMSVRAAVTAIHESQGLSELLHRCVAFTGDVDTVAAIALAAGSCSTELAADLPGHLLSGLEEGAYGHRYLAQLDRRLLGLATR
jgi:ADP-ribosylglycohydrolase